ncbi:S24 family peptidase [Profundibacter sp.]
MRVYTAEASAGPGLLNPEDDRIGTLAFKRTWLQQIGLNPAKASILRVKGDSMEPTIKDGSVVLVDEQKKQPVGNSVFAFIEDDELRIKRLDVIDGGKSKVLTITSDNPDYPSEVRINSDINKLRILGQVVWTGYNLKEGDK